MTSHCPTCDPELLSAYLDEELTAVEAHRLEEHLEDCPHCRRQLDGLSRVANSLRGLERVAPPPVLDEMVLGRLEIRGARSWSGRLDELLSSSQRTRSTIGPIFALVMMLVVLVFLFGEAMSRRQEAPRLISVPVEQVLDRDWLLDLEDDPEGAGENGAGLAAVEVEGVGRFARYEPDSTSASRVEAWMSTRDLVRVWMEQDGDAASGTPPQTLECVPADAAAAELLAELETRVVGGRSGLVALVRPGDDGGRCWVARTP